uniref:Trichohyalin-plectin-homology domain-containing protein n=1 Tax=Pavo cristatus TaxID=9049 RepID=A0A8C9F1P7_PAVCR
MIDNIWKTGLCLLSKFCAWLLTAKGSDIQHGAWSQRAARRAITAPLISLPCSEWTCSFLTAAIASSRSVFQAGERGELRDEEDESSRSALAQPRPVVQGHSTQSQPPTTRRGPSGRLPPHAAPGPASSALGRGRAVPCRHRSRGVPISSLLLSCCFWRCPVVLLSASGPRGAEALPLWKKRKEGRRAGVAVAAGGDPETRFSFSRRKVPMEHEQPGAEKREAEREHGRYMERRAVAREQLAQIEEHKHQADLAKQENKREGEKIQRLSQLYQLEIQRGKEKEQEEKLECQRQYHEHAAEQEKIKNEEKQKEDKEDDRIRAYVKEKELMADRRREKDTETSRLIEEHQDKACKKLTEQMNKALRMEDDRLDRAAAEVEDEYQVKNKEKEAKKKAAIESIAEHRATDARMKLQKEREEKAEGEKDRSQWMTDDRIYLEMEKAKKDKQHDANVELQKFRIQQMAEKQAKKQQEKQADLDYDAQREATFH